MKRGGPLPRLTPLVAKTGLRRTTPLRQVSSRQRTNPPPVSALVPKPVAAPPALATGRSVRSPRATGPSTRVLRLVRERSGGRCEWPGCLEPATETQHRLGRKMGGRHGDAHQRINQPQWLLRCCRGHHRAVTSAVGDALALARSSGWVLTEDQDAATVPVLVRHCDLPVLLDERGGWHRYA